MTTLGAQLMFAEESTYGTVVTPTKTFEFESESFKKEPRRTSVSAHRKNQLVDRSDRFEPYHGGVAGSVSMFVPTKDFGVILKHGLGTSAIASVVDSNYVQTHTLGDLTARYLTGQVNRELNDGTDQAHTFHGLKVVSLELSCDIEGAVMATVEFDGEDEDTSTALATAAYATDFRKFAWPGSSVTVGGSALVPTAWKVRIGNPLNVGRFGLRASALKRNPLGNGRRMIEWELTNVDHTALTTFNRVIAAARADTLAAIVITCDGPVAHGGTTLPRLEITIPAARFDGQDGVNIDDFDPLTPSYSGVGLHNGTDEPITITYRTTDSAIL